MFVIHSGVEKEALALKETLIERYQPQVIEVIYMSAALGVHAGECALGVTFLIEDDQTRDT